MSILQHKLEWKGHYNNLKTNKVTLHISHDCKILLEMDTETNTSVLSEVATAPGSQCPT